MPVYFNASAAMVEVECLLTNHFLLGFSILAVLPPDNALPFLVVGVFDWPLEVWLKMNFWNQGPLPSLSPCLECI